MGFPTMSNTSSADHRLVTLIMNSELLMDDDLTFVSSHLSETAVQSNRYRHVYVAVTVAAAVNGTVFFLQKCGVSTRLQTMFLIPACFVSAGIAGYIGKFILNNYQEEKVESSLKSHINTLQTFFKLVQTILSDINEIDMISRLSGIRNQPSADHNQMSFGPLAKFRKTIITSLLIIGKKMTNGFMNLMELVPQAIKETDVGNLLPKNINFDDSRLTANDLNNMYQIYQLVQSEYLCWLALCYCPTMHSKNEILIKKVCIELVESVDSVVLNYYSELNLKYFNNMCGGRSGSNFEKQDIPGYGRVSAIEDGAHRIMLHLLSLVEVAKRLESTVHISTSLVDEGTQSQEDLLKLFAININDFKIKLQNTNAYIGKIDRDLKKQIIQMISISLIDTNPEKCTTEDVSGTSVGATAPDMTGKSNFANHHEHEEFAVTGRSDTNLKTETNEQCVFEQRQLMPNVLSELQTDLSPVYKQNASIFKKEALLKRGRFHRRLDNIDQHEVLLDSPRSNLGASDSQYMLPETGKHDLINRYDTANISAADFPMNNDFTSSLSCITAVSNEAQSKAKRGSQIFNDTQIKLDVFKSENMKTTIETSTMISASKDFASAAPVAGVDVYSGTDADSTSVTDRHVMESKTAIPSKSGIPKCSAAGIIEPTLTPDMMGSEESNETTTESTIEGATAHTASMYHISS